MKSRRKTIRIVLLGIVSLLVTLIICYIIYGEINFIKRYEGIDLYENNTYLSLSDSTEYLYASQYCSQYFPQYDVINEKDIINGVYIFDGSKTLGRTSISFVLEIKFENTNDYNEYVCYELDRCSYTDSFDVNYEKYECLVTTNNEFTKYYSKDDRPYCFGMFCMNKDELIIRYVYFENVGVAVDEKFLSVQKNTNCEW